MNLSSFFFNDSNEVKDEVQHQIEPLVQRCYEDAAFKAEFLANPVAIIQRETDITLGDLPDKCKFVVVDKSDPYALYITIPVNEDALELSDEELELVAGGKGDGNFLCNINIIKCNKGEEAEAPAGE